MSFAVRSTDEQFHALLQRYLAPFVAEEGPDWHLFSADGGVRKTLPGGKQVRGKNRLFKNALTIYHGGSQDEMAGRLISSVRDLITGYTDQFLRFRGGGAELGGQVVMLPSQPNPHLPALAASLTRLGAGYLGDELVYVDPVLRHLHPITTGPPLPLLLDSTDLPHVPSVGRRPGRPGRTRGRHRPAGPTALEDRVPIILDEDLGARIGSPGAVEHLLFPHFDLGGPTEIQPMGRSQALFALAGALLNPEVWTDRAMLVMQELVQSTQPYSLLVGSYDEAAEVVARAVNGGGPER